MFCSRRKHVLFPLNFLLFFLSICGAGIVPAPLLPSTHLSISIAVFTRCSNIIDYFSTLSVSPLSRPGQRDRKPASTAHLTCNCHPYPDGPERWPSQSARPIPAPQFCDCGKDQSGKTVQRSVAVSSSAIANSLIFYDQDCLMFLLFHPDLNRFHLRWNILPHWKPG